MIDLAELNPQQRQAVTHGDGPLLVLAGAGSGKTRVITYRIAWLISERHAAASQILAVTFTNKAANEMLERVRKLVPPGPGQPTIGTFHSTALRVLRKYADRLGYSSSFVVYDSADQQTLIRRSMKEVGLDTETFQPRAILGRISKAKNDLIGPSEFEKVNLDFFGSRVAEVFHLYQRRLKEFDAMDFDDLIGNYVKLLREHEEVRAQIRERWQHVLIDEYQDTNHAQYSLVRLLSGERGNVVAVGDEDQSIYRFRGANIHNILNFERDFPGAKIVKLEQNYRSTGNILDAATGVVSNNVERKGKKLFTDSGKGDPVRIVRCETDRDEAGFVVQRIRTLTTQYPLREMAVLFRTNAQSRSFEEELLRSNIPYTVVGGTKFYERAEIKDILAYLRLAVRPHDTPSIERIINVPTRGIGQTTENALLEAAADQNVSLWSVIEGDLPFLADRARKMVREFAEILRDLQAAASNPVHELIDYVIVRSGYRRMLIESKDPQDETRLENINELLNSAKEFYDADPSASLSDWLDSITLMTDLDTLDSGKGVTLMTLHAAKGLEFQVVFLAGMEEGLLPHSRQKGDDADDVEEERRLCYVGMTRARRQLYCLYALQRRVYGQFREQSPSPFLREIPRGVTEEMRHGFRSSQPAAAASWREKPLAPRAAGGRDGGNVASFFGGGNAGGSSNAAGAPVRFDPAAIRPAGASTRPEARGQAASSELRSGSQVIHEQFGKGVILRMEGSGPEAKLTVYFDKAGKKKFIAKYAKLTRV
jgi:DNA helicase II / ATP-dependent DNA helicase PcrA